MIQIPDDPIVAHMERYGVPPWLDDEQPHCPCCGAECNTIYKADSEIVGCDVCLIAGDAWDEEDCFPNRGREW